MTKPPRSARRAARSLLRRLVARLLLSASVFVISLLVLEGLFRAFFPIPAPIRLRDGVFVSTLPLVSGEQLDRIEGMSGEPLSPIKRPGEIRIFVFGESSVEGVPWGLAAAAPTMLYDRLRAILPELDVTVVNMGRGASTTLDAYYYLLASPQFQPDIVIFYLGTNDNYAVGFEPCIPLQAPRVHAVWRSLVARSRLLWTLRARGSALLRLRHEPVGAVEGPRPFPAPRCTPVPTFARWVDILGDTASTMGAQIVTTTLVKNALLPTMESPGSAPRIPTAHFQRTLQCYLTPGCDLRPALATDLAHRQKDDLWPPLPPDECCRDMAAPCCAAVLARADLEGEVLRPAHLRPLNDEWRRVANQNGASVAELLEAFATRSPRGVVGPPWIVDDVHLSLRGYALLAELWLPHVTAALGESPPAWREPNEQTLAPYEAAIGQMGDRLTSHGLAWLSIAPMTAIHVIEEAALYPDAPDARVLLGWLRQAAGLPAAPFEAPPEGFEPAGLAERIPHPPQNPAEILRALHPPGRRGM